MITINAHIKIKKVFFRDEKIFFTLEDGREIGAPIKWYGKLAKASERELHDYSNSPSGYGVHWNKLDEDLSAFGMLNLYQEQKPQSQ